MFLIDGYGNVELQSVSDRCRINDTGGGGSTFGGIISQSVTETHKETVIRLLKQDFEKNNGITFEDFISAYNDLLENEPEKLI